MPSLANVELQLQQLVAKVWFRLVPSLLPLASRNIPTNKQVHHWKFGTSGSNYFQHATRELYAIVKDLTTYISTNR
jgi:hypothetical protein